MSFLNKVVLITGASAGIGAATATKFIQNGANVALVGRNKDRLNKVSEICTASSPKPLLLETDVTNDESVIKIINDTINHYGKLDVLVNNAGIISFKSILSENCMETFDKVIATNLRAAVYLTHLSAPHLIKTKGNIVNISSVSSFRSTTSKTFAYDTSKAALDHFTRSSALELAPKGVRVNSVNPGLVQTDILRTLGVDKTMLDSFWDSLTKTTPLGKLTSPEEIADLVLFIAGDKAKSITGSTFVSDNGSMLVPTLSNVDKLK